MPLERSDAFLDLSDPNIVLGPRKRRATECLLENGDPLAYKKNKADHVSTGMTVSSASADKDNHTLSSMPSQTHPTHTIPDPRQATKRTKRSNDKASGGAQSIVVEDSEDGDEGTRSDEDEGASTEEDDNAELGAFFFTLVDFWPSADRSVNQSAFKRNGMYQYMLFLSLSQQFSMSEPIRRTSFNVWQANVKPRNVLFIDTWTQAIPGPPAICGIMPKCAGVMRQLTRPMPPKTRMWRRQH